MRNSFKVTLVVPYGGRRDSLDLKEYVRTWQMEDLGVGVLAYRTPRVTNPFLR